MLSRVAVVELEQAAEPAVADHRAIARLWIGRLLWEQDDVAFALVRASGNLVNVYEPTMTDPYTNQPVIRSARHITTFGR